jgi:hypothetical protein
MFTSCIFRILDAFNIFKMVHAYASDALLAEVTKYMQTIPLLTLKQQN